MLSNMILNRPRTLLILSCALFLGGCGIKPNHVDPPEGAKDSTFPAEYPNPQTDPQPGLDRKDALLR